MVADQLVIDRVKKKALSREDREKNLIIACSII